MDDLEPLIRRAQSGDGRAFEELLQQCYDSIFRFALKYCGNRADAEDITHQACLKLARSIKQFRFQSAFSSWLYRLVINCGMDWQKSHNRHRHEPLESDDRGGKAADADTGAHRESNDGESQVMLAQVMAKIAGFGEGYRETVVLVFGEGLSHAEAADILSVKESTISWRIHDIRKRLHAADDATPRGEGADHGR
ncbi:MAG: RNA polymerase sigma factor [bacterium]